MGSSVLEINVGLCASISVCKFQFIFAKASLVVKLLCASCESRGDFLCPCTVVTCLETWQQVTVKSWPKSIAKNQNAGRFAVVSARLTNTANSFFTLSAEDSLFAGQHPRAPSGTGNRAELQRSLQSWWGFTAEDGPRHRGWRYSRSNFTRAAQSTGGTVLPPMGHRYRAARWQLCLGMGCRQRAGEWTNFFLAHVTQTGFVLPGDQPHSTPLAKQMWKVSYKNKWAAIKTCLKSLLASKEEEGRALPVQLGLYWEMVKLSKQAFIFNYFQVITSYLLGLVGLKQNLPQGLCSLPWDLCWGGSNLTLLLHPLLCPLLGCDTTIWSL